jgi:hypothetical protein
MIMKSIAVAGIIAAALVLTGCGPDPEYLAQQKADINEKLPDGCIFKYYGRYADINVSGIECEGASVSNTLAYLNKGTAKHARWETDLTAVIRK